MNEKRIKESDFTDYLANNLELIEKGLTLVAREVRLQDPDGASGRVDIVARDRYQNTVVIEVKCSDKVAREAAHELFKYSEILRAQQQLKEAEFRCILVSTHWRELHRSFSAYATTHHDVVGYLATRETSETGWVLTQVKPLTSGTVISPTSAHMIFLYENPGHRKADYKAISQALEEEGMPHHFAFMLENEADPRLMYRYALYLVIGTSTRLVADLDSSELAEYPQDPVEHYLLDRVTLPNHAGELENGSPEKLRHLISYSGKWTITGSQRTGAFAKRSNLHDDALLSQSVQELPGFTSTAYSKLTSPSRRSHWNEVREQISRALPEPERWLPQVDSWLDEIEIGYRFCDVRLSVLNLGAIRPLMNLPFSDLERSPMLLRAAVIDPTSEEFITGVQVDLRWDGETNSEDIYSLADEATGGIFGWLLFYPPPEAELKFIHSLGMYLDVYELQPVNGGVMPTYKLEISGDELRRRDWQNLHWSEDGKVGLEWHKSIPFYRFSEAHHDAIREFKSRAAQYRIGRVEH